MMQAIPNYDLMILPSMLKISISKDLALKSLIKAYYLESILNGFS
jgi:hypothetical protein